MSTLSPWKLKGPFIGMRVEIPPSHDTWMRGARFGTVVRWRTHKTEYGPGSAEFARGERSMSFAILGVRMDHPQIKRLERCDARECRVIDQ